MEVLRRRTTTRTITFRTREVGDRGSQVIWVPLLNYNRFLDDPGSAQPDRRHERVLQGPRATARCRPCRFIVPSGASEHPPGSIQAGERFVRTLVNALMRSSALDELGVHVDLRRLGRLVRPRHAAGGRRATGYGLPGPALLVSPYAKTGLRRPHHARLHVRAEVHREQLGRGAARRAATATRNDITVAFDFTAGPASCRVFRSRAARGRAAAAETLDCVPVLSPRPRGRGAAVDRRSPFGRPRRPRPRTTRPHG